MTETLLFLIVTSHVALWRVGGMGWKWARRILLPVLTAVFLFLLGIPWHLSLLTAVAESVTLHLGYGEGSPLWKRALISSSFGFPALVLYPYAWWAPLITLSHFGLWYAASRRWNFVWWGLCEMMAGFSQGTVIALAYLHP